MQILHIALKPLDNNHVELRYWSDRPANYERQVLPLQTIEDLIEQSEQDYYVLRPDLSAMGKRLFLWLDGAGRWLSRAINECAAEGIVLAIAAEAKLSHLPWETLHDGNGFLIERDYPLVVPIRWLNQPAPDRPPQPRPLQILFMATSPENVQPVLNFEQEEASILRVTRDLPLTLRVEESGCVPELEKLWRRYPDNTFDVFHLTGHASVQSQPPYSPYFITESLTGERQETTVAELQKVFQVRRPRLIFLSGCRTGQGGNQGSVPSFAEALVRQGLPAVLGWGRSIADAIATRAAAFLYERLAAGDQLGQAVALTHRFLLQEQVKDWHLLRLYVRGEAWGALVEAPGDYVPPPEPVQYQFLDVEQKVRVATPEQFVGRRRTIQRCLRALREARTIGVLLHGLGGVGKSSTAARLLERLPDYQPLVIYQELDTQRLEGALFRQCTSEVGQAILNSSLPLMQRLTDFLKRGLNEPNQKLMVVLDDFEANLEPQADGSQALKPEVVEVLIALLQAIGASGKPHRVLITSRYDARLPELDERLYREPLAALQGADLQKKCERLPSFQAQAAVDPALQSQARTLADGNPRLLEWLDLILQDEQTDAALILERMEQRAVEFRESTLAQELLNQQNVALRTTLARGLVFELPVPLPAMTALWTEIPDWQQQCDRAVALGLLESIVSNSVPLYRVPRLLAPLLPLVEDDTLSTTATAALCEQWWEEAKDITEEQALELYRLAKLAQNLIVQDEVGVALADQWLEQGRYREAGLLYEELVEIRKQRWGEEHPDVANSLNNLAYLYESQGRYGEAEPLYQQALQQLQQLLGPEHPQIASSLNNLAALYKAQGRYGEAEPLLQQALQLRQQLLGPEHPQIASSLNNLALLYKSQGRYGEVEPLLQQALQLNQQLLGPEHPDVASSLNNLAALYESQGRYEVAEPLYLQALQQLQRLLGPEHPQIASSLNNLAYLYQFQGRYEAAELLYQQALQLRQQLLGPEHPDVASSLNNLAALYQSQGRYEAAELLFQQALQLRQRLLGPEHPDVASSLNNLAALYQSQGRYEAAELLFQQALQQLQRLLGPEHPNVASSLNNLAGLYESQGRYEAAEPLYLQALQQLQQLLGPEHP
ncbi:tetratricopeptide repeat protein, partial [Leptolyngbya sp. GB1-A1]|uniref:tetratricopeptide repeat protein n=1 Tax=Leptolyngbya sp. GB1-A1 TaxID=2933908 RepID=UPI003296E678